MGIIKAGIRCQQCGGRVSKRRFLEKCSHCGAQGNYAYAVRQWSLHERSHWMGEHRVAFFAALGFFALFVGASRMVGAMSKNQIVQEVELTKVVERIGSINKNLQ